MPTRIVHICFALAAWPLGCASYTATINKYSDGGGTPVDGGVGGNVANSGTTVGGAGNGAANATNGGSSPSGGIAAMGGATAGAVAGGGNGSASGGTTNNTPSGGSSSGGVVANTTVGGNNSGGTSANGTTGCELSTTTSQVVTDAGVTVTAPSYDANRTYCPDNTLLGTACVTTKGALGTLVSKCAAVPDTCGYLYCVAS